MATTTSETATRKHAGRALAVLAGVITILGVVALAILFGAIGDANINKLTLTTTDQITQVLTDGVLLSAAALVLGIIGLLVALVEFLRSHSRARLVTLAVALLVAVIGGLFLFTTALPRAQAVQNLNDHTVPFARSLAANCQTPLDNTTADLKLALSDTQANISNNASFAAAMQTDAGKLQADAKALSNASTVLAGLKAPDAKYDPLLQNCQATVKAEDDFLTNDSGQNAIALPPPYNVLVPGGKVSGIDLVQDAGAVAGGSLPIHVAEGQLQPLVAYALTQVVAVSNPTLTQQGNQLKSDIQSTLDTNLAPYVVKVPLS